MEPNLEVKADESLPREVEVDRELAGGAARSLRIQAVLRDHLFAGVGDRRASRALSEIQWVRAQNESIQRDDHREVWHAGQVSAIVSNGHDAVAGTGSGGVWVLKPGAHPQFVNAVPLSDGSDVPDISCLAWGPDRSRFVFVGCTGGSAIFLLEFDLVGGGLEFKRSITLPVPFSAACNAIVTFANPGRIVVANNDNVWWSPIPNNTFDVSGYVWRISQGLPSANYSGMAVGSDTSVVAAISAALTLKGSPPNPAGIYRGTFQGIDLVFTQSKIIGTDPSLMRRTSVASCLNDPRRLYAVSAGDNDQILAVLSSRDGGINWTAATVPNRSDAGFQGFYNNCIAVSAQRPDVVVIGWLSGGAFWSTDAAQTWSHPHTQESNGHLHNDLHALYFASNPNDASETVYVGGDGGIVFTRDLGITYDSQLNHRLHNLQFYRDSLTASSRYPGLLAGGTQDNGNIYLPPGADPIKSQHVPDVGPAWRRLEGGDGSLNRFIDPLGALLRFNNTLIVNKVEVGNRVRLAFWDATAGSFGPGVGTVVPADGNAAGITPSVMEVVQSPNWRKNGQLMYAIVSVSATVYGFFADGDGSNAKLLKLGVISEAVGALASLGGATLLVGTTTGRIFSFESSSGVATEFSLPDDVSGGISRLEVIAPLLAYALAGTDILRSDGRAWTPTTPLTATSESKWLTFAVDSDTRRLFAATDSDVWVSHNHGRTWVDASNGLPKRPHCNDLRVGADAAGGAAIYLASYGRSVWRATITRPPDTPPSLPQEMNDVLVGIFQDGWGLVVRGGQVVPVPPPSPLLVLIGGLIRSLVGAVRRGLEAIGLQPRR